MTDEIIINNWADFNQRFDDEYEVEYRKINWLFRGQSNKEWGLKSSIYRIIDKVEKSEEKAREYEVGSIEKFFSEYILYQNENDSQAFFLSNSANSNPEVKHLVYMQHHASPTRLLDWTESPYVALYFAVIDNLNCDGAIFLVNTDIIQRTNNILCESAQKNYPYIECFSDWVKTKRLAIQQGWFTISNRILVDHQTALINQSRNTKDFCKTNGYSWFFLTPENTKKIKSLYGVKAIPSYYLIDPYGNLMMQYKKGTNPSGIIKDLERLIRISK